MRHKKYFEHIDHSVLGALFARYINDKRAVGILDQIVKSFTPGVPLGNLSSQLFANIYLNPLDHYIKERLRPALYSRYCDDFILAHPSRQWLMGTLNPIQKFLDRHLHLTLHPQKTKLRPFRHGIDWLGYVLYPGYRVLRPCTRKRMWRNIRCAVDEYFNGCLSFESLRSTIASYNGIIKYGWNGNDRKLLIKLWECI